MSQTVDAIGYRADVPTHAKEKVSEKVSNVRSRIGETASRVGDATPSGSEVKHRAKRAAGLVQENPLGLAVGAVALGFLAGLAVPSTRVENEKLGPVADQVKDKVKETGQEAFERGKEVAQQAASSAVDTARQEGQQHGQDLTQSARSNAEDLAQQTRRRTSS